MAFRARRKASGRGLATPSEVHVIGQAVVGQALLEAGQGVGEDPDF
jgi:hypothetical protein